MDIEIQVSYASSMVGALIWENWLQVPQIISIRDTKKEFQSL